MEKRVIRFPDFDDADLTPVDALLRSPPAEHVADAIRSGIRPNERFFDRFLPYDVRCVSEQFWTPLPVALRVAEWLDAEGAETVVDVGSGAGKFCVAAALASRCTFIGIEQRPRFVAVARALAELFGVSDRVHFVSGALDSGVLPVADAYYLYNPFGENLFGPEEHLDEDVELSHARYDRDIAFMEGFFDRAPAGTLVVKYNGFGGQMPFSYDELRVARDLPNLLRMWRKGAPLPHDP